MDKHHKKNISDRLIAGGFWALLGKVLAAITGLLTNSLLARLIPPSDMGRYFLIISFVTAAVFIVQFGSQQFVVRKVPATLVGQDHIKASSAIIWSVLRFGLLNGILTGGLLIILALNDLFIDLFGVTPVLAILGVFLVFGRAMNGLIVESLRGLHDIKNASIFNLGIANLLTLIAILSLWYVNYIPSLEVVLMVVCAASILSMSWAWLILRRNLCYWREVDMISMRHMLFLGFPLFIISISTFIFSQADLWVVGTVIGADAAGLYGAVVRLIQIMFIPLLITNAVLPPIISELWSQSRFVQLERTVRGMCTLAGIPAVLVLGVFVIMSSDILRLVYGDFYIAGSSALILLSIGYMINVYLGSAQILLVMTGYDRVCMGINILFGVILIVSLLIIAPFYGFIGVAAVTSAIVSMQAITTWYVAKKLTGIYTHFSITHLKLAFSVLKRKYISMAE